MRRAVHHRAVAAVDYCLINDGAVCLILTSKERAKDFKKPPC